MVVVMPISVKNSASITPNKPSLSNLKKQWVPKSRPNSQKMTVETQEKSQVCGLSKVLDLYLPVLHCANGDVMSHSPSKKPVNRKINLNSQ